MQPFLLPPNQLHRFYKGGARIAELRSSGSTDDHAPEEWIASMTSPFGEPGVGLAVTPDGTTLADAVRADPEGFLGAEHVARFGPDVAVLIKLLDAGERLPVHLHPDDGFATEHLDSPYGKTEAWIILDAEPDSTVHVGWREPVDEDTLRAWVEGQDASAMLGALRATRVAPGDTIYVPARTPHAIGAGILLAELQQPTDFSILLEWKGFAEDEAGAFLGLGLDLAIASVDRSTWTDVEVARAWSGRPSAKAGVETLFPADADVFFRAERIRPAPTHLEPSFSVLLVVAGDAAARGAGWELPLRRGDALLVPFGAGECELTGDAEILRCLPPVPGA